MTFIMAHKPNFTRKKKRKQHGATFWNQEYTNPTHLKLSTNPSEDLLKCVRFLEREGRSDIIGHGKTVLDVGCGNGRNLIHLARAHGMQGYGIDIASAAIAQAVTASKGLPLTYAVRSIGGPLPQADESVHFALDMMTSHFLSTSERALLRDELHRVLTPGGMLFMKTFLKDEDLHTARLLTDFPGPEEGTYIHPVMGVPEYVYDEETLRAFLGEKFIIKRIYRSHKHAFRGQARKRRTITIYAEKDFR